jgi:hypothetical protein
MECKASIEETVGRYRRERRRLEMERLEEELKNDAPKLGSEVANAWKDVFG